MSAANALVFTTKVVKEVLVSDNAKVLFGTGPITRYTVRGRGAKHFFPSGSAPRRKST